MNMSESAGMSPSPRPLSVVPVEGMATQRLTHLILYFISLSLHRPKRKLYSSSRRRYKAHTSTVAQPFAGCYIVECGLFRRVYESDWLATRRDVHGSPFQFRLPFQREWWSNNYSKVVLPGCTCIVCSYFWAVSYLCRINISCYFLKFQNTDCPSIFHR